MMASFHLFVPHVIVRYVNKQGFENVRGEGRRAIAAFYGCCLIFAPHYYASSTMDMVVVQGRTGEAFMKIAKTGHIQDFCQPNALLTLQEYMQVCHFMEVVTYPRRPGTVPYPCMHLPNYLPHTCNRTMLLRKRGRSAKW